MSLFVANLAFGDTLGLELAKVGILVASVVAGIAGVIVLLVGPKAKPLYIIRGNGRSDLNGVAEA